MFNATLPPLYPRERAPMSTAQEAGWSPEPVWTGEEKTNSLDFTGIRISNLQVLASRDTD